MSPAEADEPLQLDVLSNASAVNAVAGQPAAASRGKWEQTAHGKGRVRPRKNQPPSTQNNVPRLTAVAHTCVSKCRWCRHLPPALRPALRS